jgi:hypothetical protein
LSGQRGPKGKNFFKLGEMAVGLDDWQLSPLNSVMTSFNARVNKITIK